MKENQSCSRVYLFLSDFRYLKLGIQVHLCLSWNNIYRDFGVYGGGRAFSGHFVAQRMLKVARFENYGGLHIR
jgi:hypothetical protein